MILYVCVNDRLPFSRKKKMEADHIEKRGIDAQVIIFNWLYFRSYLNFVF